MIDLKSIASNTNRYNFHSHTQYCDGRATMEDVVKEAIKQGFLHLGFSPHSPVPLKSPCNMSKDNVQSYLNEVNRLRLVYGDKINLYSSMEIDYINEQWCAKNDYFSSLPLDYRLSSIHFIPSMNDCESYIDVDGAYDNFGKKVKTYFNGDIEFVVNQFYSQTLKMIEAGGFDLICHFDKIGNNASSYQQGIENEVWYQKLVRNVFDAIMDYQYIIEINTKAFDEFGRFFPNQRYFKWIKDYNAPVLINSDVHFADKINSGRYEAEKFLNEILK